MINLIRAPNESSAISVCNNLNIIKVIYLKSSSSEASESN